MRVGASIMGKAYLAPSLRRASTMRQRVGPRSRPRSMRAAKAAKRVAMPSLGRRSAAIVELIK